jgi:tRNA G18 (ribose-2'-O)-methylase SpoU
MDSPDRLHSVVSLSFASAVRPYPRYARKIGAHNPYTLHFQAYRATLTFFVDLSYNQTLLAPDQSERVEVVLVSPRNPLNIGAAARAMANFGLHRLAIVSPFAVNWTEAKSAVGAPELLREARVFDSLGEAVKD